MGQMKNGSYLLSLSVWLTTDHRAVWLITGKVGLGRMAASLCGKVHRARASAAVVTIPTAFRQGLWSDPRQEIGVSGH